MALLTSVQHTVALITGGDEEALSIDQSEISDEALGSALCNELGQVGFDPILTNEDTGNLLRLASSRTHCSPDLSIVSVVGGPTDRRERARKCSATYETPFWKKRKCTNVDKYSSAHRALRRAEPVGVEVVGRVRRRWVRPMKDRPSGTERGSLGQRAATPCPARSAREM